MFTPIDEDRVIVEGRRWFDDGDDPSRRLADLGAEFSDGLYFLSAPAKNAIEAESTFSARH